MTSMNCVCPLWFCAACDLKPLAKTTRCVWKTDTFPLHFVCLQTLATKDSRVVKNKGNLGLVENQKDDSCNVLCTYYIYLSIVFSKVILFVHVLRCSCYVCLNTLAPEQKEYISTYELYIFVYILTQNLYRTQLDKAIIDNILRTQNNPFTNTHYCLVAYDL